MTKLKTTRIVADHLQATNAVYNKIKHIDHLGSVPNHYRHCISPCLFKMLRHENVEGYSRTLGFAQASQLLEGKRKNTCFYDVTEPRFT